MDYTVKPGDCMSSIAFEHGFFWKTLWNLPENAALKAQRNNPNVLMPGDVVHIPDKRVKQATCPTDAVHQFVKLGVPEKLHIKLLDRSHQPRPNLDYVLAIDGKLRKGTTDGDGMIHESIPPNAQQAKLTFAAPPDVDGTGKPIPGKPKNQVMILQLGQLNPVSAVSGLKARLANLGFYNGPIDENLDDKTKVALNAFQARQGIPVTGAADAATLQQLQSLHGH